MISQTPPRGTRNGTISQLPAPTPEAAVRRPAPPATRMTPVRRRSPLSAAIVVGVAALVISYFILRPTAPSAPQSEPASSSAGPPAVACLGLVDVDGGVAALGPTQPGRVVEVCVQEGDTVAAGAVLMRLDDRPAKFDLELARTGLTSVQVRLSRVVQEQKQFPSRIAQQRAAVESAEHRLAAAQHHLRRQEELLKINNINAHDVNAAESQVKDAEAQVKASREKLAELNLFDPALAVREAQADVSAAVVRVRQAEYTASQCELRAPSAGTVLRVQVSAGEMIGGAGSAAPFQFRPDRPFIVRAEVEQEFVHRIAAGQPARVEDEANPGTAWPGVVERVAGWYAQRRTTPEKPAAFKDVATVECVIRLVGPAPPLRIGQRVVVMIGKNDSTSP